MPARLNDIKRALAALAIAVEEPNKGSHYKAIRADGRKYTIPAHNGGKTMIGDEYIRGLCRFLEIDIQRFKGLL
ncbi:hypothetical protein [Anaeromyxobacter sp. SG66]|uniref:hypothetical protein n=1 Tax=Anaeromyxobacter sp. SG66 TaxID=2925410 RepID=UPI001F5A0FC4|nr:hypothetical protein [Anaeromyxobacter sp. SG66]